MAVSRVMKAALLAGVVSASSPPPNVLLIVSDDLRPDLGGLYGQNEQVWTPNLEALMDRSVTFTKAYCQYSLCSPSRTSFLTGLRPDTTGVYDFNVYFRDSMKNNTGPSVVTLPQFFKEKGYLTIGAGKVFHPGSSSGGPSDSEGGGDEPYSWSEPYWFCDQFYNGTFQSTAMQDWPQGTGCVQNEECVQCMTEEGCFEPTSRNTTCVADCSASCFPDGAVADQTLSELKRFFDSGIGSGQEGSQPFFFASGLKRPHMTWFVPPYIYETYDTDDIVVATKPETPTDMPILAFNNHTEISKMDDIHEYYYLNDQKLGLVNTTYHKHLRRGYYSAVSFMDEQLGRIIQGLRQYGFYDNTIIAMIGDHGYHLGEQGAWSKQTNFELGVRVPLIVRSPHMSSDVEGRKSTALVELLDLFPTIVELAGYDIESDSVLKSQLEGKSVASQVFKPGSQATWPQLAYSQIERENTWMGLSIRDSEFRYTLWCEFDFENYQPDWQNCGGPLSSGLGMELYLHNATENDYDAFENANLAYRSEFEGVVQRMDSLLRNTWDNQDWSL